MSWIRRWGPALAWAVVISAFSTGAFTSENTGRIIIPILHGLLPGASPETLVTIHYYIRKTGHFVEYFVLGLLLLRALRGGRQSTRLGWALGAIAMVAAYAALDEFHQSFVPGRTARVTDVLLDTIGGIAAQLAVALACRFSPQKQKRSAAPQGTDLL